MWVGREDWGPFGDTNTLLGNLPPIQGSSLVLHGGGWPPQTLLLGRISYILSILNITVFPLSPRVIGDWRVYFDVFKASSKRWYHIRRFQFMRHVRFTMWTNNSAKIWIKIFSDKGNIQGVQILFIQIWVASSLYNFHSVHLKVRLPSALFTVAEFQSFREAIMYHFLCF